MNLMTMILIDTTTKEDTTTTAAETTAETTAVTTATPTIKCKVCSASTIDGVLGTRMTHKVTHEL